jgi:hypothetical protein
LSSRFGDEHAGENLSFLTGTQMIWKTHGREKELSKTNVKQIFKAKGDGSHQNIFLSLVAINFQGKIKQIVSFHNRKRKVLQKN